MKQLLKDWSKHIAAIAVFVVLVVIYFAPAVIDGKTIVQPDNIKAVGMGGSQMAKYAKTAEPGEFGAWSDAMFGGMPYVAYYGNPAPDLPEFRVIEAPVKAIGYFDAAMVLTGLICFYILMCCLGVNWWLAVGGSIAFAFASYNIIIIEAGHIIKAYVIAYMPLTLAGMTLLFKKKYIWGSMLFLLGVALSIANNHIQITYYLAILCVFIYLGYAFWQIRNKSFSELGKVTAIMVVCAGLAVLPNAKSLYANWELGKSSIRGETELTSKTPEGEKKSSGLDKDYAFAWSYGKGELITFLIPNAYGGGSGGYVDNNSALYKELKSKGAQLGQKVQTYTYWGDKSFTSGPVYFGALVCLFFVLGMFVIRNQMKWWLFAGSVFLILLALGRNLDWFNDFMFHYLPMYNKFRTVEMALVIPGLVFPIIGIWGLSEIFTGKVSDALLKKGLIWSVGICGGICLIVWLMPTLFFNFQSPLDPQYQMPDWYYTALLKDRASLASSDALRSLIFILIGAGLMFIYLKAKDKQKYVIYICAGLTVLVLIDLWSVDKRYLDDSKFVRESAVDTYKPSVADKEILKDKDLSYRVINLNNPFQETTTSYFHHSVGGYHAAKLRRYQELIEHRLDGELKTIIGSFQTAQTIGDITNVLANCPTLNMLNTRYVIFDPSQPAIFNPYADGNCWFVNEVKIVENADAEIEALNVIDPRKTAVVDKRFEEKIKDLNPIADSTATIVLEKYRPNRLTYKSKAKADQVAIFSEIYYQPGWNVTIDGKPADHFRADWILRAMNIPAGEHTIVFDFHPQGYVTAGYVSSISSFMILLLLIALIGYSGWIAYKKNSQSVEPSQNKKK